MSMPLRDLPLLAYFQVARLTTCCLEDDNRVPLAVVDEFISVWIARTTPTETAVHRTSTIYWTN
jgi:hypothetical protein